MTLSLQTGKQPVITLRHRPRVLVIDDEIHWHHVWSEELSEDCELHTATSGKAGLQMMQQIHPDLVILDRNMPRMSGDEVLREIRRLDTSGRIRVVMHSVRDDIGEQIERLSAGADIYVPKTTDMRIAAQTVRNLLTTQRSAFTAAVVRTIRRGSTSSSFADQLLAKGAMQFTSLLTEGVRAATVDLTFVTSQVLSIFDKQMARREINLNINFDEHSITSVLGDEQMLATALFHIVDFVSYRLKAGMHLDIGIVASREAHSITVQASIHLTPDEIHAAFWWQLDEYVMGRDLGLPLAWEIVTHHGGMLRLEQDAANTVFILTLPAYQQAVN